MQLKYKCIVDKDIVKLAPTVTQITCGQYIRPASW